MAAPLLLPAVFEGIRGSLADWYGEHWTSLNESCVSLSYFNDELQAAVVAEGLAVDDLMACRNPIEDEPMWTQWAYKGFATCVGFSAVAGDATCLARELVCATLVVNPANMEYAGFGTYAMQAEALVTAINFENAIHPACPFDGVMTLVPGTEAPNFLIEGCTDPASEDYNPAADGDDGSCTYPRSNTDFGVESRWWMNWRLPAANVRWIQAHPGAVTTIHPAHNLFVIQMDGTLMVDQWFREEKHLTPYKQVPHVDIMPAVDFEWSATSSSIHRAFLLGEAGVYNNLMESASKLADLAVKYDFSGFMLDYEPYFGYTIEHTEAFLAFISMVKHAVDDADRRTLPTARYAHRRVGVCLSDWGIIDVTDEAQAAAYAKTNADIVMSMGYTYFMPVPGEDGFAMLRERVMHMKKLFPTERVTIGVSVEIGNAKTWRWYDAGQTFIDQYVKFIHDVGLASISVWGMWDTYGERQNITDGDDPDIELFAQPLDTYIAEGHWHDTCKASGGVVSQSSAYANALQSYAHLNPNMITIAEVGDSEHEYLYGCVRTCVAAPPGAAADGAADLKEFLSAGGDAVCDNSTHACAGADGASYGSQEDVYMAVADAVATATGFHPNCPMTREVCEPGYVASYWRRVSQYAAIQAIYPLDANLIEMVGNEWYYNCKRTGVGRGQTFEACDPRYVFCVGQGSTFGYGQDQLKAVATAVASADHLHPLAPRGCDDHVYTIAKVNL